MPSQRASPHTVNLPPPTTPFTGRGEELAELAERLSNPNCRLLTLVGPGGIGKTRLALQLAADHVGIFRHGVHFISLAAIDSTALLATTIADTLPFSLHGSEDPAQQLLGYLREKNILLVLDNMEHVLEAGGFITKILQHAPQVAILVTSRERLRLREEWVYEVDGLTYPQNLTAQDLQQYSAVTLFTETAQRLRHRFALTEQTRPWAVRICQVVGGMPLAVELAAAWTAVRSCEEIARDIERNLDVLETSLQNVPQRHRSVRAAFEHSWAILSVEEQQALHDLSVFRNGFRPEAAEEGLGISPVDLATLVEKSLVRRDDTGRYHMHELLRQYAAEKLQQTPQRQQVASDRHGAHFTHYLGEREEWLKDQRQGQALKEIAAEIENIRAAWQWATTDCNAEALAQATTGLGIFYTIRGWNQEGNETFRQATACLENEVEPERGPPQRDAALGQALAWQGSFAYQLGRYEEAKSLLRRSLDVLDRCNAQRERAFSLLALAQLMCHACHDYPEAARLFQESLGIYQENGDRYGMAHSLDGLGDVAARQGKHKQAEIHYEAGLNLRREIGDLWGISTSLGSLGGLAGRLGEYDAAQQSFEESLEICRQIDNQRGIAACLHNLSTIAYLNTDYREAQRLRLETLSICREIGYRWGVASSLKSLGDVYRQLGEYEKARRSLKRSLTMLEEMGNRRAQAFALNGLGMVAQALGNDEESWGYFREALKAAMEIQEAPIALDVLSGIAVLLAASGQTTRALEVAAFVEQHPASEQQTKDTLAPLQAELRAVLTDRAVDAAKDRGQGRTLEEFVASILDDTSCRSSVVSQGSG